jgi:hypothetical protein
MLLDDLKDIGDKSVKSLRQQLKDKDRVATGKTSESIKSIITEEGTNIIFKIIAREFTNLLEKGRPSTGVGVNPSKEFVDKIQEWIDAKGLDLPAYAVAKKIHDKGYKGTDGLITIPLQEILTDIKIAVRRHYKEITKTNIINGLRGNSTTV